MLNSLESISAFAQSQGATGAPQPEEVAQPEEQSLLPQTRKGLGRDMLATMDRIRAEADEPKINPLLATSIMGSAMLKNKGTDQRAAEKAAEADSKVKITFNADGSFDAKGIAANDFMRDAESAKAGTLAGVYSVLDKMGVTPRYRADDPELSNGMTYQEVYDGAIELGASPRKARQQAAKIMRDPKLQAEAARQLRERRSVDAMNRYKAVKPIIDDQEQDRTQSRLETTEQRRNFEQFLGNNLVDLGTEDDAVSVARERITSSGQKWNDSMEKEVRAAYKGQRSKAIAQHASAVNTRVNSIKDEDVRGYGPDQIEEFVANQEAEFGGLTEAQRVRFRKRFNGLQQEIATQRRREERAEATLAKRISGATTDKPAKIPAWQASSLTTDALLATLGDPLVEQGSARFAVHSRLGKLEQEYNKVTTEYRETATKHAQTLQRIEALKARVDKNLYDNVQSQLDQAEKEKIDLEAKVAGYQASMRQIGPELQKVRDGLQNGGGQKQASKFTPQIETGIAAYMAAKGYGADKRQTAIDELKAAGKLPK